MHRGKNRSRKLVDVFKSTPALNSTPLTPVISSLSRISPPPSSISHSLSSYSSHLLPPSDHLSPSSRPSTSRLLNSGIYSNADHRYFHGMKEEMNEHPLFSEAPIGAIRDFSTSGLDKYWQPRPSTMSCPSSSVKDNSFSLLPSDYFSLQLQSLDDSIKNNKDERCIALGKCEMSILTEREPPQKAIHHFFDEWLPRDRESWLDLDGKSSNSGLIASSNLFP